MSRSRRALESSLSPGIAAPLLGSALDAARRQLSLANSLGLGVLLPEDPAYPGTLRGIPDEPLLLFVRGSLPDGPSLAVVGSRRPSARGRATAHGFAREASAAGAVVISGLAFGVDAAAHEGALAASGKTVAVLASGLDGPTPRANRRLAQRILDSGGAWVSEHPPGTAALPFHFPERNRLISGLASHALIIEARERSGSLWTARHALEQGREVLTVPGPIDTEQCRGSNGLLRDGATPILDSHDLLFAVLGLAPGEVSVSGTRKVRLPDGASAEILALVDALEDGPRDLDDLGRASGLTAPALAGELLELELAGVIRRQGRRISLCRV